LKKRIISLVLVMALTLVFLPENFTATANTTTDGLVINFEDGRLGGFEPRPDSVTLTVTNEQAYSGRNSLLVSNRTSGWHGVGINIGNHIEANTLYDIVIWLRLKSVGTASINLFADISPSDFRYLAGEDVSNTQWTRIRTRVSFSRAELAGGNLRLALQSDNDTAEYYIGEFSVTRFDPNRKAKEFQTLNFENGEMGGIRASGNATLTITNEQAYSGTRSLFVSYPAGEWGSGITLDIYDYVEANVIYDVSMWIYMKTPDGADATIEGDSNLPGMGYAGSDYFGHITLWSSVGFWPDHKNSAGLGRPVSPDQDWRRLVYRVEFTEEDIVNGHISINLIDGNGHTQFYIDDFSFTKSVVNENIAAAMRLPSIKESYANDFLINGGFWNPHEIYQSFNVRHFNQVRMPLDEITINYLTEAGVKVWNYEGVLQLSHENGLPAANPDGTPITRSQARDFLEMRIEEFFGRYVGQVYIHEVFCENLVNWDPAAYDGDWRNSIRTENIFGTWLRAYENGADKSKGEYGADFIYDAFVFVRQTDPTAKLAFDEFFLGLELDKRAIIRFEMIKDLNERWKNDSRNTEPERLLIEILTAGFCHIVSDTKEMINFFIPLGVKLGVGVGDGRAGMMTYEEIANIEKMHPNFYIEQANIYAKNMLLFKEYSEYIEFVGIPIDNFGGWDWKGYNYASESLFNDSFNPTLAYFAVVDPEGWLAGEYLTTAQREAWIKASALNELGLFRGVGTKPNGRPNFALNRAPTRYEAVTMLVRLLGKEDEALAGTWETPFTDVTAWASPYVGYAFTNGLTSGTGATTFGGSSNMTATQYLTFVLRALGYTSGVDFQWDRAWELSDRLGFTNEEYNAATNANFTRGGTAAISYDALSARLKDSDKTLYETLID
jgi:hypothetical protein